jgi:hypothetical protein
LIEACSKQQTEPLRLIFHLSHCGSTLVSRLLQEATAILPLREPASLRALAAFFRDLGHPLSLLDEARYHQLEALILQLLARSYPGRQGALVKATSDCSNLACRILELQPKARAALLYLPLEGFLATMLRSELRRRETQSFAQSRLADLQQEPGCEDIRIHQLDAGQLTAMSWLSNLSQLHQAATRYPERCRLYDFETFLEDPAETLQQTSLGLDLDAQPAAIDKALSGPIMQAYSKDPTMRYDQQARQAELRRSQERFADQIESGMRWAGKLTTQVPGLAALAKFLN